jgi:hypothetical protein
LKKFLFFETAAILNGAASDKAYQLFTNGRWFSLGTPSSSATKTGRHDIAEILVEVALKRPPKNESIANH